MAKKTYKRAALYARYSSDSQNESTIETQKASIEEYAKNNDYVIVKEYIDRGKSAFRNPEKRPMFQIMMQDAKDRKFDALIIYKRDRYFRNFIEAGKCQETLEEYGIKIISVLEPIPEGASGFLSTGMIDMFSEYFSRQLSERITDSLRKLASKALYLGGSLPFGYTVKDKKLVLNPDEAPIVKEVFERFVNGETQTEIARDLTARGYKSINGNKLDVQWINRLLKREKYTGVYIYSDTRIEDGIPKIIDKELFETAQEILMKRNRGGGHGTYKTEEYLLTGKLVCGICGGMVTAEAGTSKTKKVYHYYKCNSHKKGHKCELKTFPKEELEKRVAQDCYKVLTDKNIEDIAKAVAKTAENDEGKIEVNRLKKEIADRKEKIFNLLEVIESGKAPSSITEKIEEREQEIEELNKQLDKAKANISNISADEVEFYLYDVKAGNIDSFSQRRTFINTLIDKIYIYNDHYTVFFKVGKSINSNFDFEEIQKKK